MPNLDDVKRTIDAFFSDTSRPREETKDGLVEIRDDVDQMIVSIEADG